MAKKNKGRTKSQEQFEYDAPYEAEEAPEQPKQTYKITLVYLIDQEEVNTLISASTAQYVEPEREVVTGDYPTYSEEECTSLMHGKYPQRKTKKKK